MLCVDVVCLGCHVISKQIEGPIRRVLDDLFSDTGLAANIDIVQRGLTTWDPETRQNVTAEETYTVAGIRLKHSKRSVAMSKSPGVQVGDRLYMIRYDDAPEGLSVNDVIVDDGQTLDIKAIDRIFQYAYSITVEGS